MDNWLFTPRLNLKVFNDVKRIIKEAQKYLCCMLLAVECSRCFAHDEYIFPALFSRSIAPLVNSLDIL